MFAVRNIHKDEILFEESPFIGALEWDKWKEKMCAYCTLIIKKHGVKCSGGCSFLYCNEKCRKSAWDTYHSIECTEGSQGAKDLYSLFQNTSWNAGLFAARAFMHLVLSYRESEAEYQRVLQAYNQFYTVDQEEISKKKPNFESNKLELYKLWSTSYFLLMKHLDDGNLPISLKEFLTFETYKKFIGKRNLNSYNGGLFILQSALNHSCHPNIVLDDIPSQFRIRVRALRDIRKDEQLFQTYVAPFISREQRAVHLQEAYLFTCDCIRCKMDYNLSSELLMDIVKYVPKN